MNTSQHSGARCLALADLSAAYRERRTTPLAVVEELLARIAAHADHGIWITLLPLQRTLEQAELLAGRDPASLPLYGIPFAIKDNIDLANVPTTAACAAYAYTPAESAQVVQRLMDAGAIPIGKTNLDQFATGLVGTRSPYGVCRNSFDPLYISGGSSSGSAVAVALGLVSFALGTDTAGSGRVPAAFNNLIGLKPTCGRLSSRGVVPACRTLDTVSVLALTAEDAALVCQVAEGFDALDAYSRRPAQPTRLAEFAHGPFRFGVPRSEQLQFFGNKDYARLFDGAVAHLERLGGQSVAIDFAPFLETARLLYQGPWVAERYVVVEPLLKSNPDAVLPVTRQIIGGGAEPSAADAFRAQYRLQELRRTTEQVWQQIDVLLTPTAGTTYRIAEVEADPVRLNTQLGLYTNFMNLLDLAAVAVPAGFTGAGLPFGVTLAAPAWSDYMLLRLAARLHRLGAPCLGALPIALGAAPAFDWAALTDGVAVAVCGAHLQGLPLNHQLLERGAVLLERTVTATNYRLYALPGGPPARPGLVRVATQGVAIDVELWSVPRAAFGGFVAGIPAPLAIGKLTLADGRQVSGFLCEAHATSHAQDISDYGGWRAYQASRR
ncbi:MAG TPA: allophanate hydrolase [Steroidobacteraceae bacterium]|jgi:allophanate hydrolase|nr:allophanate hydrolase [Steroidobacteraceae bacterium]